ncbi:MAG: TIR domain-containing protein, partial [Ktedonobacteraceae bacterium]
MTNSPPARTRVFICYSQEDARYLRRLQTHLAQGVRDKRIDLWDDTMIRPGAEWQAEIKQAMQSARVAVLLVSVDFLASDFINETELPSLLEAVKSEGVTILPVLLSPCRYEDSPLAPYQFVNQPRRPLSGMNSSQRDENWVRVARAIDEVLSTPLALEALAVEVQPDEPPLVPEVSPDEEESPSVEAPSCSPIAERYRQALLNDQAITRLQVLGMGYHFPISDIYVRVQLHENMGASVSRKSTSQDPRALMQQKQRFLEERFTTAIDPEVAIRKYNHCIILGDPGAGKTTLLKYLATKSIENQLLDLPALPLYIRLNAFAASGYDDILAFAAATWASDYKHYDISKEEALAYIKDQVAQGNILLLLDALDEAAIGETVEAAEASYRRVA